jgi:hypothetical protein
VLDRSGLEPGAGISELVGDDAHAVEVGIVEVDLVVGVGPPISDRNSSQSNASILQEGAVADQFVAECGDVVPGKGLPSDVEGTLLQGGPLLVQVG